MKMQIRKSVILTINVLVGLLIFSIFPIMSPAEEGNIIRTQGLINPGGNLKNGYLMINEMRVYFNKTTRVMNHHGAPIPITELKPRKWVYIEIEKSPNLKKIMAKKIYLLLRYIHPEERRKYSFMK